MNRISAAKRIRKAILLEGDVAYHIDKKALDIILKEMEQ